MGTAVAQPKPAKVRGTGTGQPECVNTGYPPLVITLEQRDGYFGTLAGMQTGSLPAVEAAVRPLQKFLAACLAESLDFATAAAEGRTDPTWNNADANLQRSDAMPTPIRWMPLFLGCEHGTSPTALCSRHEGEHRR